MYLSDYAEWAFTAHIPSIVNATLEELSSPPRHRCLEQGGESGVPLFTFESGPQLAVVQIKDIEGWIQRLIRSGGRKSCNHLLVQDRW